MNFTNRIAIVTGGTGALGRVIVNKFAEAGMKVYVPVRSLNEFNEIFDTSQTDTGDFKGLLKRYALPCDATNDDEVKEFCDNVVKQEKRIDYLINTVGGFHPKRLVIDTDKDLIENQLKLNFYTTFYFTKHSLTYMRTSNFGRVISIGAKPAIETTAGKLAYSISKAAVINLMQTLAEEFKEQDLTFNAIIPSIIDTPANRKSMQNQDFSKWVSPDDIAAKCLELAGNSLNGEVIKMYGRI